MTNGNVRRSPRGTVRLRTTAALLGVSVALVGVACGDDDEGAEPHDTVTDATRDELELPEGFEPFELPRLDLESRQVEIPGGMMHAEPWDDTSVGQVTDDLFVGVRVSGAARDESGAATAYLCDDELAIVLEGEIENGRAVLTGEEATVELELIDDGVITGTVALSGDEALPFTAEPAVGNAGVYTARHDLEGVDMTARWIVLPDGQQRGNNICCVTHPRTGQRVCYPCWHLR